MPQSFCTNAASSSQTLPYYSRVRAATKRLLSYSLMSVRPARGCWSVYNDTGNVIETHEHAGGFAPANGVWVPNGYVSGTALSTSATWNHASLAGLGLTPVRLTMSEGNNGQGQDKRLIPQGDQSRYTGEILLRTRPKTYHSIARELADPNASVNGSRSNPLGRTELWRRRRGHGRAKA
jgi:hypothetical protein